MRGWCGVKGVACDWVAPTEDRHELRCCRDGQLRWTELGGSDECLPLSERRAVHKAENQICRSLRASRRRPSSLRAKIKLQTIISPPSRSDNKGLRVLATRVVGHVLDSWIHALAFRIAAISDRTSLFRPRIKSNGHRLARERVLHRAAARTVLRQRSIRTERTSDRASSSCYHAVTIYSRGMKVSWQLLPHSSSTVLNEACRVCACNEWPERDLNSHQFLPAVQAAFFPPARQFAPSPWG